MCGKGSWNKTLGWIKVRYVSYRPSISTMRHVGHVRHFQMYILENWCILFDLISSNEFHRTWLRISRQWIRYWPGVQQVTRLYLASWLPMWLNELYMCDPCSSMSYVCVTRHWIFKIFTYYQDRSPEFDNKNVSVTDTSFWHQLNLCQNNVSNTFLEWYFIHKYR